MSPSTLPVCAFTRPPRPSPIAARKSTGLRNVENTTPRHSRANTRASRSTTRNDRRRRHRRLVLERAAGEDQEHVFEARPPHEHRRRADAVARDRGRRCASPSSVYTSRRSATGSTRGAERRARAPARRPARRRAAKRSSTTSRVACVGDQLARRALGDDAAAVHDHEPVAELLGLVHVVRREHERDAAPASAGRAAPTACGAPAGRGRWSARRAAAPRAG